MKTIYKIIYWLIIFQTMILFIHVLGVFPENSTFYSNIDLDNLETNITEGNIENVLAWMFVPPTGLSWFGDWDVFTMSVLVLAFTGIGVISAYLTHSFIPVVVVLIGVSFWNMFVRSVDFFKTILGQYNNEALWALGMIILIGIMLAFIFAIVETPTHGEA